MKTIKRIILILIVFSVIVSAFAEGVEERRNLIEQLSKENSNNSDSYSPEDGYRRIEKDMSSLTSLYKYLERNYLWEIDYQKVYESMADAMFKALGDKYTYYVSAEESSAYTERTTGKYGGIGISFTKTNLSYQDAADEKTLYPYVTQIFPGAPADNVGMSAGDLIIEIDGVNTVSLSAEDCAARMKGDEGTSVKLLIKRNEAQFEVVPVRAIVNTPSVTYGMVTEQVGYMRINQFYKQTLTDLADYLKQLVDDGMKGLIIDLRDCIGGDVQATIGIANLFIKDSDLLYVNYKDTSKSYSYVADQTLSLSPDIPIVILVNENTASSAEILSSTMRDNKRAVLIGTTTYGKGIMQAVSSYGTGKFSVTVAELLPPSNTPIHKVGVKPDIVVENITITQEQAEAYTELIKSGLLEKFTEEHPEYTKENVQLFIDQNPDIQLDKQLIQITLRNVYYNLMNPDKRPIVDTWFDPQVTESLKYLDNLISD